MEEFDRRCGEDVGCIVAVDERARGARVELRDGPDEVDGRRLWDDDGS